MPRLRVLRATLRKIIVACDRSDAHQTRRNKSCSSSCAEENAKAQAWTTAAPPPYEPFKSQNRDIKRNIHRRTQPLEYDIQNTFNRERVQLADAPIIHDAVLFTPNDEKLYRRLLLDPTVETDIISEDVARLLGTPVEKGYGAEIQLPDGRTVKSSETDGMIWCSDEHQSVSYGFQGRKEKSQDVVYTVSLPKMNHAPNDNPTSTRRASKIEGYDKLAAWIASDRGLSIYRRFSRLNAKNLLYLQAEIITVAEDLQEIIDEDKTSEDAKVQRFATSVWYLKNTPSLQWARFLELRSLLNEYNNALIQQAQLLQFNSPHSQDLKTFRKWLRSKDGVKYVCSTKLEQDQWNDEKDLIALCGRYENVDHLTRWLFRVAIPWFDRLFGERIKPNDPETGTVYYDDGQIIRGTRIVSTVFSSVFPASSMLVLYVLNSMAARLVVIIVYNVLFSMLVGLMTRARRVEIFAASVAFAAVQVAFITNFSSKN
ncbi:hypothetical protein CDV55_101380 [Aspergillus turcosus]|uniref:DUF6594 domain-containing protein n=1 Tax=Aspergillus turcosus TaxID=1245748 RepID=A0A229WUA9_9EURO|nr:hypothetical protein CDV55_101380 [Aspergillus turcosus]RLL98529.1 hypothetical protein CFD26_107666 [Aspergillus turcosus]